MTDPRPIGVFDSGVGGLTVLSALRETLPHENFVYLGDTARVPYGTKSASLIQRYAEQAARYLLEHDIKLLIIACNTVVSAEAIPILNQLFPSLPIIGVVDPGAHAAVEKSKKQKIGVLATRVTLQSGAYTRAIQHYSPKAQVFTYAAPLLVPLAEEGWLEGEVADSVIQHYLKPLLEHSVDCLLLGCTHYPLFVPAIIKLLPKGVALVDSAITTAQATADYLKKHDKQNTQKGVGELRFYVTDDPSQFAKVGTAFLGEPIMPATVSLADL